MKKITALFLYTLIYPLGFSQCYDGVYDGTIVPAVAFQTQTVPKAGKYYEFVANFGTTYQFSFCQGGGSVSFDNQLTLLDQSGIAVNYVDDVCGVGAEMNWTCNLSGTYRILATRYFCDTTDLTPSVMAYRELPPNPIDSICHAMGLIVDASPVQADNIGATPDVLAPGFCWSDAFTDNDVWFSFVAPSGGSVAIETFYLANIFTQLSLYQSNPSGSCTGALTEIGCNEFGGNNALIVATGLTPGETYFVRADGYFGDQGSFLIQVRTAIPPVNDMPCNAIALTVDAPPVSATNEYASAEFGLTVPSCFQDFSIDNSVWFSFVAPPGGAIEAETFYTGGLGTSQIAVYSGNCSGTLTELGCNEFGFNLSFVQVGGLTPGQTYYLMVDGYFANSGFFDVQIRTPAPVCSLSVPNGAIAENEACGSNVNYGCNGFPEQFTALTCGQVYTGKVYNDFFPEDEDWYKFSVNQSDTVYIRAQAQFEMLAYIYNVNDCNNPFMVASQFVSPCTTMVYDYLLPVGNYALVITPSFNGLVTCSYGNEYWLSYAIGQPLASVTIDNPGFLCTSQPTVSLTVSPPQSGTFSGPGVNPPNLFSPATAGIGLHTLDFSATPNANGCLVSDSIQVQVSGLPMVNFTVNVLGMDIQILDSSQNVTSYSWNFGDGTTSSLQNPTHTYQASGFYNVVLIGTNPCGVDISNQLVAIGGVGVSEFAPESWNIFPNPAADWITVEMELPVMQDIVLKIYDMNGRVLKTQIWLNAAGMQQNALNIEDLESGMYLVSLEGKFGSLIHRMVKY